MVTPDTQDCVCDPDGACLGHPEDPHPECDACLSMPYWAQCIATVDRQEHRFLIERQACLCGWRPPLGTSMYREFDRHLLSTTDA